MAEPVALLDVGGFRPEVADKVLRLMPVLDRIRSHPFLGTRVCLHGGTALNLFVLRAPRLSVDIDLNYIANTDREAMMADRPRIENAIVQVGQELGFNVLPKASQHAGRSFLLKYQSGHGVDQVKIDVDYLNRAPLLPVQSATLRLASGADLVFPLNSTIELFAGKTKALLERVAVRDLYDVSSINVAYSALLERGDSRLLRRVMLYYLSVSAPFPRPFQVASRFSGRDRDVVDALYPVLLPGDRPTLAAMIETAEQFVATVSQPVDASEAEYVERASRADFAPELLFADYPATLSAAQADPAAAWKIQNLAKR